MICWLLLVPAGVPVLVSLLLSSLVPVLVSLLLSSFFPQDRGLFHHDLLVPPGSGWGSGACLPSSLFFLSSGKRFCSIMICWFLLVPAGVPVLVSLLLSSLVPVLVSLFLSSFFPQERGSVPSWFAGSSWFRLGFRCLFPFFSLLWFQCLPSSLFRFSSGQGSVPSWFAGSSWFRLGFRCLSPFFSLLFFLRKGVLCHHDLLVNLLVPAGVPVLVSLLLSSLVPVLVSLLLSSFFPQERGSVPSWFAGSSWFRLGFRCLSPFFSLHSFLRKGFCSIMICWFLLVPAGVPVLFFLLLSSLVPVLVSLLLSCFFPQDRGSVPSWFAGSSWFRLGFRCLSPFFSLISFLRKGVLFHHDLLVSLGSGWGSGACLPSSPFFLSSGKRFCSIMICWFLLVPGGVPVLVSLLLSSLVSLPFSLLSSFFPQERGSVPSWFAGSSWFRPGFLCLSPLFSLLWFRCLSPFLSLVSFLKKGVPFHHDLLVLPGSGWGSCACLLYSLFFGSGACLLSCLFFLSSGKGFCSIMICWFLLVPAGVPVLVSFLLSSFFPQKRVLFHHDLLVPLGSGWGSGAFLPSSLFFGSGACLPSSLFFLSSGKGFCSIMIPAGVPVLASFFSLLSFLRKSCLPSSLFFLSSGKGFCSIMICWFLLVPAGVPVLVSLLLSSLFPQERGSVPSWFAGSSWFRLGFRCLSPFFSLLWFRCLSPFFSLLWFRCLSPSSLFFLSSGKGFCSIMICWFLLVPAGVPVLVSFLLSSFFPQDRGSVPSWFAGSSWFRLGFRCLSPFFSLLSFLRKGVLFHHDLLVPLCSGWGSGACLPSSLFFGFGACLPSSLFFVFSGKGFCSIMICWFFLVPAGVPVLVSLLLSSLVPVLVSLLLSSFFSQERGSVPSWFAGSSWFRLGFRCLSPFFSLLWFRCLSLFSLLSFLRKGVLFHHDLLVPPSSGWGSGACLPSSLFFGSGACLPSSLFFLSSWKGFCSIMICWFLLVPAGVPVLVSLLLSSFFPQERGSVSSWFVKQKTGVCQTVPYLGGNMRCCCLGSMLV